MDHAFIPDDRVVGGLDIPRYLLGTVDRCWVGAEIDTGARAMVGRATLGQHVGIGAGSGRITGHRCAARSSRHRDDGVSTHTEAHSHVPSGGFGVPADSQFARKWSV